MCDTFFQTSYVILYSQLSDSEHIDLVAYTMETYLKLCEEIADYPDCQRSKIAQTDVDLGQSTDWK